jgi:Flp pilus assembly protein TadB
MIAFALAVGLCAVAALHAYRLAVPARTDLVAQVQHWDADRARASRLQRLGAPRSATVSGRLLSWASDLVLRRGRDVRGLTQDLAITGTTLEQHIGRTTLLVCGGFFGPIVIVGLFALLGLSLPAVLGPAAGLFLGAAMVVVTRQELAVNARKRRAEFRRTLSIYLDLVAMSLQAGRGHAEAVPAAAAIGSGWGFTHMQDAIEGARFSGVTAWRALGEIGERFGIRELTDLEAALTLASDDGAKVLATLESRAETLRAERVADAEAAAVMATESMRFALIVMVFAFLAYEIYPSVVRLFAG